MQLASIAGTGTPASYNATSTSNLGTDAFLQLLVAQLRYQDPLSPMKDNEFIAQLAQLNTLEQLKQLNAEVECMLSLQVFSQAAYLLGKEVQARTGTNGTLVEGAVSEVRIINGIPVLVVDGHEIALAEVVKVVEASDDSAAS